MLSANAYHHHDAQQHQPAGFHTAPLEKVTLGIKILKTHSHSHSQIADNPKPLPALTGARNGLSPLEPDSPSRLPSCEKSLHEELVHHKCDLGILHLSKLCWLMASKFNCSYRVREVHSQRDTESERYIVREVQSQRDTESEG